MTPTQVQLVVTDPIHVTRRHFLGGAAAVTGTLLLRHVSGAAALAPAPRRLAVGGSMSGFSGPAGPTFPVPMATFTNPTNGATNVDTTAPFTWTVGGTGVQGYRLTVGTTFGGNDVVDSGPLPATQTAYTVGSVPTGTTLHARIYTETDGNFSLYQDVSFSAAAGMATFTKPTNGATNVDTTLPFTWTTGGANTSGYYLTVGSTLGASDLINSGTLPASQTSYQVGALPTGATLYARIYTKVNSDFSRYQDISFTAAAGTALFTNPTNGATNVDTTLPFTWTTGGANTSGYYLTVGSTLGASDLINSGTLPASQTSYQVGALPTGATLYARIYTKINGNYNSFQDISFKTAGGGT